MKIILYSLLFFIILTTTSLKKTENNYIRIAEKLTVHIQDILCKKYGMTVAGNGGGMRSCVYEIGIAFQIYRPLNREQARALIIECSKEMISEINACKELRPYLKDYPVTDKNIDLAIFSFNKDGTYVYDPYIITSSVIGNGQVSFETVSPDQPLKYKNYYLEDFDEAVKIVEKQRQIGQ